MLKSIIVFMLASFLVYSVDNGLGLTPQMGWNSWNHYACNISEVLIKKTADLLISTGLADKGYKYVNLDDCWQISRNPTTKEIIQDKDKFPSGMRDLGEYLHQRNLKFGLYSDAGTKTCQGRPGGYGYEEVDANTYAKWKVDYLKYDNCYHPDVSGKVRYYAMHKALNESGRHIFYSMCNWGQEESWKWAGPYANSWRTTGDISDNWKSMTSILDKQVGLEVYAGKGGWNDPDMLEVGNGGMTKNEYYAHFALWCLLKAPLLIGCALDNISEDTLEILGNTELIEINQDSLGVQGTRIKKEIHSEGTTEVWGGKLSDNRYAVIFFNRAQSSKNIEVSINGDLKLNYTSYSVRDVINHKDLGVKTDDVLEEEKLERHSVSVYVLKIYKGHQRVDN